ncbi:MAG: VWA domain-containing protein [Zoogloeaceae bacterium]|jgi:Ca-activated chloride channel family protein|nr:VWA domain-containing protein [Zoogloeaceae bacterium]
MKISISHAKALLSSIALVLATICLSVDARAAESVNVRVELDRSVLPVAAKETVVVKISLDGARNEQPEARPPINLGLVIDRSGSMGGEKIEQARLVAIEAVRRLSGNDIVSVVAFDSEVRTLVPATRVTARNDIEKIISHIMTGNSTALYAGVVEGAAQVREHLGKPGYTHRVILLSDGQANVGPSTPDELGALGVKLIRDRISVTTIGLGLGYDEDLMTRLALKSDGNTYFARNAGDLSDIFRTELGDVLNVVARDVKIIITFPAHVRPLRFVGREGIIKGQRAELTINQIYGGQEKFALVEMEISGAKDGERLDIATTDITYEDARAQKRHTRKASASARFSADQAAVIKSANLKVQADHAEAIAADAKDEAVSLSDKGQRKEAAARLRQASRQMNNLGKTYGNQEVLEAAQESAALADELEQQEISNERRKALRTGSAQQKSQQGKSSSR